MVKTMRVARLASAAFLGIATIGCTATATPIDAPLSAPMVQPADARAHWLAPDLIAAPTSQGHSIQLVAGNDIVPLQRAGTVGDTFDEFPHLADMPLWRIEDASRERVAEWLKGPVMIEHFGLVGDIPTGLQIGPVLDALYANDEPLGARLIDNEWHIALWAPTARSVRLVTSMDGDMRSSSGHAMAFDAATGIWSARLDDSYTDLFYGFDVEVYVPALGEVVTNRVTDPYAVNFSPDSVAGQLVDLANPRLMPTGWGAFRRDLPEHPEDRVIYELHVRDFSASDPEVPDMLRGGYGAFAGDNAGTRHLARLAEAGLSDVHLLPTNDCASIPEKKEDQREPGDLTDLPANSEAQQAHIGEIADRDSFNWCYDPLHYFAPEGSYATNPDGPARIREFRNMVMSLDRLGLGTVLDVVFNHAPASGQADKSVLDKIVPGYYHRLDETGAVTNSTCCSNLATERHMMERILIDAMIVWARDYKVSGFRFDLMGHHERESILKVRDRLAELTLEEHGVDGKDLLIYGEGWNFGEVANDARFVQATQANMAGTGIGTFNDRMRDAVRGGAYNSKAEQAVRTQGFASGLYAAPNRMTSADPAARAEALRLADHVRAGLAGSIAGFAFANADGVIRSLDDMDYNGAPLGYVRDPQEAINYAAAHDNPTLFDSNAWKLPLETSKEERVRWQNMGNSLVILAQGIPFIHAGQELLRTKSLDHNSYNSGDWFNRIDFSGREHWWGRGLAHRADNEVDWPIARQMLADERLAMGPEQIARAAAHMEELLAIRNQEPLFRMRTGTGVKELLRFDNTGPDQVPGLIVMRLGSEGDEQVIVVFNATRERITLPMADARRFALHPVQAASDDPMLGTVAIDAESIEVPAVTTAIFLRAD
ncbi:pullulanase-type alpha-1,6-glucosidase [Sphingomicrobium sediminis]|uniref:Pullulanase-type alpha-1,6-glucosidase n=1 Tax=Sphingomicrobium sediminis TaxID=2950949 RepID=A0A9X2EHJ5_9SPHN|nr:pullulanase-type alpha-1,6-glucosidase [Sphingomicrobium sediminis]MCM8558153.1 pullulanase-type alpha-1,6-glucosidase [Sphingomicrobium sediminis]